MEHKGTIRIETERLILRRFVIEDSQPMFDNWASHDIVTRYLTWPTHKSADVANWVVGDWVSSYEKPDYYQWAIVPKELGQPIGSIAAVKVDDDIGMVEIGYCIGDQWWGKGIVTEAFSALLPFFFGQVGANRIQARHDVNNPASGRVMQKCGLKYEGTLRKADRNNQGIVDACYYSILKEEFLQH